ncbi:MAG TPA: phosphopantothenoylcysteine decarboxylase [Opitutaceae bacterium]|nr:phosphopantothenoylcysteine decarboxylase [Opitutaceae bacterium]
MITAGPTREHLDPVRFLSNASSGKMGYALAKAAAARHWWVDLVSGPVALAPPKGVAVHRVVSGAEMFAACEPLFAQCDLFIAAAAVADYRPKSVAREKLRKSVAHLRLELVQTVDILKTLAARKRPGQIVIGFAAETRNLESSARRKLMAKKLDWIVANDVSRPGLGMESDDNAVILLSIKGKRVVFGPAPKTAVASFIFDMVAPAPKVRENVKSDEV